MALNYTELYLKAMRGVLRKVTDQFYEGGIIKIRTEINKIESQKIEKIN